MRPEPSLSPAPAAGLPTRPPDAAAADGGGGAWQAEQILFDVAPIRDGRSYITREVQAKQDNEVIFVMIASFHVHEPGPEFQRSPEELAALLDSQGADVKSAQELIDGGQSPEQGGKNNTPRLRFFSGSNHSLYWTKHQRTIRDDSDRSWIMHCALLAYMSDEGLLSTVRSAIRRRGFSLIARAVPLT